jgi:hypothetical protein
MQGIPLRTIVGATVLVAGLAGVALAAQDRYTVKVPHGLSFAEFKGYETWQAVSVSQVKEGQKLIAANAVMMNAYKAGLPARGKTFPEGSKVVKIEWSQKEDKASPYFVMVPDKLMSVSFIEKDSKRFPKTHGWAYAQFLYDPASASFKPNGVGAECGYACHTGVAAQDYIFTAYPRR